MKQKLLVDIGGDLELKHYEHSLQVVPSSALITIYDDAGSEKVAETAASIDATTGTMSYTLSAALADDVYSNWKAVWKFVVGGNTLYRTTLFDIVRVKLENPVIDQDIIDAAPFLKGNNYSKVFTAESGSKTTIVSPELTEDDDYWNGGTVEVVDGTDQGQIRKVTDFVASSNTLTVESFTTNIDTTSKILLIRTFKKEIDRAFDRFKVDVKNRGIYIDRIIDNSQVKEYIITLAISIICMGFSTDVADIWFAKGEKWEKDYKKIINVATFDYDDDNDGNIESDEEKENIFQPKGAR
jgi:hypothetical protein